MPIPIIPIGILWIIAAATTIGILGGVIVFLITKEGTAAILVIGIVVIAVLLIPYLPNRYKWVRDFKRKIRFVLREGAENAEEPE